MLSPTPPSRAGPHPIASIAHARRGYIAPGDSIFDPFGGIGGRGYHAMLLGLHWTACELEPRFVELGQRNIDKWQRDLAMLNGTLGTARLLQGDSRRLLEVGWRGDGRGG
jgi:tRNA G10  N-methylase Trm11